ncbi:MAG: hypothetical protein B7Z78_00400 [Rhodospirillales bacterium 20-60-12]|nr:MAG: hypothetical protein B7Z78_00400 [Rhodospirillales bacterium 20-60-12]HQT68138.1 DUF1150 family protein [Acetobacteraceae bacterium]
MDMKSHDGSMNEAPLAAWIDLHNITAAQLGELGMEQLAYVKPVMTSNGPAFGIFAANGTPMAIASDGNLARAAIIQHEMAPAFVH